MKIYILSFAASLLFAAVVASRVFSTTYVFSNNISIGISENESEMRIKAKYPVDRTEEVNAILKNHFQLQDWNAPSFESIINREFFDQHLNFKVRAKPGNLNLIMIKSKNDHDGWQQFKSFGDQLKNVLAK